MKRYRNNVHQAVPSRFVVAPAKFALKFISTRKNLPYFQLYKPRRIVNPGAIIFLKNSGIKLKNMNFTTKKKTFPSQLLRKKVLCVHIFQQTAGVFWLMRMRKHKCEEDIISLSAALKKQNFGDIWKRKKMQINIFSSTNPNSVSQSLFSQF